MQQNPCQGSFLGAAGLPPETHRANDVNKILFGFDCFKMADCVQYPRLITPLYESVHYILAILIENIKMYVYVTYYSRIMYKIFSVAGSSYVRFVPPLFYT